MPERRAVAIVDDDPAVRASLASLLRSAGLAARCFESGSTLLAEAAPEDLSCIVTDLHMPGMNGLELQKELACRGWRPKVILMTAYPSDGTRAQALAAGAAAYLAKPVDPDALLDAIATASR